MFATHLVESPRRWLRTWQCRVVWVVRAIPKAQCKKFLLYWNQGIIYCICGHFFKKVMPAEASFNGHGIFSQFKITSLRRSDLTAWKKMYQRNFEGIRDRFVNLNSKLIELKKSVSRWARTRRKISLIEWRNKSFFNTERIGGSL